MILTLTANPAIDRTITVDRLAFEDRSYIRSSRESVGGRGINASCVIYSFGGDTLAIVPAGGESGARFEALMSEFGYPVKVVPIRNNLRTNLTITDAHGLTVKLNEAGPAITKPELARLEKVVWRKMDDADWLMLCGSLPPGVPSDFYAQLISSARKKEVKTLLDTDGEALREGIDAKPTVVTPNQLEAERLLNTTLLTRRQSLEAAERIQKMGAKSVVLSLGSRGAIGAFCGKMIEAIPPRIDAVCPIGAGDALAAAFVWAMEEKDDYKNAVRWGVAAGTASSRLPGLRFATAEQTKEIFEQVDIHRIE